MVSRGEGAPVAVVRHRSGAAAAAGASEAKGAVVPSECNSKQRLRACLAAEVKCMGLAIDKTDAVGILCSVVAFHEEAKFKRQASCNSCVICLTV